MKKITAQKIGAILIPAAFVLSFAAPALAHDVPGLGAHAELETSVDTGVTANLRTGAKADAKAETRENAAVTRASTEIANRIAVLTGLKTRINAMVRVSQATKDSLSATITATITSLENLKVKIATDTAAELKTDMLAITQGTRVYMLVVPQIRIFAAAEREGTIADMMAAVSAKVHVRIADATAAGKDTRAIVSAETDMNAKIADAKIQAQAAITAATGLTPDNGDSAKMQANVAALKNARAALKAGETDLRAAQKDMKIIISGLKGSGEAKIKMEPGADGAENE